MEDKGSFRASRSIPSELVARLQRRLFDWLMWVFVGQVRRRRVLPNGIRLTVWCTTVRGAEEAIAILAAPFEEQA